MLGPKLRLALVQQDTVWQDRATNLSRAATHIARAAELGARVVAFPELFTSGFTMASVEHAEPVPGPSSDALAELAVRHGVYIIGTAIEAARPRPRNAAFALSPAGEILAVYHKIHPFSFGDEDQRYSAGDQLPIFEIDGVPSVLQICYDLRFPEPLRWAAGRGAMLGFVVANWPSARVAHWSTLLAARAIENQLVVVGVNRAGRDPLHTYPGASAVHDARGEVLARADDAEQVLISDVYIGEQRRWREQFPALRDRRPEVYGRLDAQPPGSGQAHRSS